MHKSPMRLSLDLLLIMAIAIGILLRFLNLGSREYWYDEVLSLLLSTGHKSAYYTPQDLPIVLADYSSAFSLPAESSLRDGVQTVVNLLRSLVGGEPHPPVFFLSEHFWLRLLGNSEAAMRSLVTLLSVAAIGSAYGLGRLLLSHRGGLTLAALLATNPFYLFHSLNLRMYGSLVLWTILSAWALLELAASQDKQKPKYQHYQMLWTILLIGSVALGLLTFYLFAYWLIVLVAMAVYLDRQHLWQHLWRLGTGVLLTSPWMVWGARQQLHNADVKRFGTSEGFVASLLQHLQEVVQTLGIQLLVGDWVTSLPSYIPVIAGLVAIALLVAVSISLQKKGDRQLLAVSLLLSAFLLLLALAVDIVSGKFIVGFGWGRSLIVVLPGFLLLIAVWLEQAAGRWQSIATTVLLFLYLSIGVSDFSFRQRQVFHQLADLVAQAPTTPTLIAMNSKAWGHVLRLAYYIPTSAPVSLLACHPAKLALCLEKVLKDEPARYSRIIWLDSADSLWSPLKTEAQKQTAQQRVRQVLPADYQRTKEQHLSGTMSLDTFTVSLYTHPGSK